MYEYNTNLIERDSEFKYYFLGFVASDGWVSDKSNRIEITLKKDDVNILVLFRDLICPGKKISHKIIKKKYEARKLLIDNKIIKKEIMKYLNTTDKTKSLIFPYGIPDQYIRHFIRGYIDGDGNLGVKKGRRILKNGQENFYYGLRLRVLGTRAFLQGMVLNLQRIHNSKINVNVRKKESNVYYVEFGFKTAEGIMEWLYNESTYFLQRKKEVFQKITRLDNDTLHKYYNTYEGHYNMQSTQKCEGIVDYTRNSE